MTVTDPVRAAEVRQELVHLTSSSVLRRSTRLCRFLTYIVEAALDGRDREIKEQAIGMEVFDRGPAFDSNRDNIVRIEASRLRNKLREYYESAGRDHRIRITIPKGAYVPVFDAAPNEPELRAAPLPRPPAHRYWILLAVISVLCAAIAPGAVNRWMQRPIDPETQKLYQKGRYLWGQRTRPSIIKSLDVYKQALARRSNYADGWTGLADSYAVLAGNGYSDSSSFFRLGIAAAKRAIQIDPRYGRPHASLASILSNMGDFAAAEREFKTAVRLSPDDATAHQWYGHFLGQRKRFDEGLVQLMNAEHLDPTQPIISVNIGDIYVLKKDYERALEQFGKALDLQSDCLPAATSIAEVRVALHQCREELPELERWHAMFPEDEGIRNGIAICRRELSR